MPTITLENGAKITLADGATDDEINDAVEDYIANNTPPAMSREKIEQKLPIRNQATGMPNGMPLPYGMTQEMLDASNKDVAAMNEVTKQQRGNPEFLKKVAAADEAGFMSNLGSSFMDTIGKFGEGAEELVDQYLPQSISRVLNYQPGGDLPFDTTAQQRIDARKIRMGEKAEDAAARGVGAPVSSTIGGAAPYLATGSAANKAIDAVVDAISPITRQLIQKGLTRVAPLEGQRFGNLPNIPSEFGERAKYLAKAPAIGAAEAGVNYDQSAGEGALNSLMGSTLGLFGPLTKLSRVENVRDANSKAIIREMHGEGFALTPGVRTGNRAMQTEEAGMRNSDVLGDYYHQTVTRPNQRKMTELAGDAIGLDGRGRDTFSAQELSDHLSNLKSQYNALENGTTGTFTSKHMKEAADVLNDLKPTANRNTSPADRARYEQVKSITNQIRAESTPISNLPNGARTFSGTQYQGFRQRIQDEASQAFRNGDTRLGNALNKLKASLDDSIESGMNKATASEWKDLNERYAMTNMIMKHGMTPTGAIDPMGITSAVMKGDEAIRTLTGKGGRIQKLQKIAKYNDVLNDVEGGSLTGLGNSHMDTDRSLTKLPFKYKLPLYARATGAYRLSRIPTYGLGPTSGMQVGRAIGMTEPLDKLNRAAQSGYQSIRDWLESDEEDK